MRFVVTVEDNDPAAVAFQVRDLLYSVVRINRWLMRKGGIPPLYTSGVRFRSEPWADTVQHAANCSEVLQRGWGECKSLCCYLMAQRISEHPDVDPERFGLKLYWRTYDKDPLHQGLSGQGRADVRIFHCQLRLPDGSLEDPSRMLHQ